MIRFHPPARDLLRPVQIDIERKELRSRHNEVVVPV
jgi:hypothetical protein